MYFPLNSKNASLCSSGGRQLICLDGTINWQQEADIAPPQGQTFSFLLCSILVDFNPVIEASGARIKLIFISQSLAKKRRDLW